MNHLNEGEYRDKVLGCWMGKNIGGTLGTPLEGKTEINEADFYVHDTHGAPLPNDDLDLQLAWFQAIKQYGLHQITPDILAEYWIGVVNGPWNEYGVARTNLKMGLRPPLSGSCNNDRWKWSNGAWIRSEIWACSTPGQPDRAIDCAWMDACVDHTGEGIYAEMFTAAVESAAFVVGDTDRLLDIGLSKIPADSRVARSVAIAREFHRAGKDWKAARAAVLESNKDLGWFQAPANIGFTVIGLLYGEGDFGKTICRAMNCGDDTDCTAATAGAIWGIQHGARNIPTKWSGPIGDSIVNVCLTPFMVGPRTLTELARQVCDETIHQGVPFAARAMDKAGTRAAVRIGSDPTRIDDGHLRQLSDPAVAEAIWARSPYSLFFSLPHVTVSLDYITGPEITSGVTRKVKLTVAVRPELAVYEKMLTVTWRLPADWTMGTGKRHSFYLGIAGHGEKAERTFEITPVTISAGFTFLELEIVENGRLNPTILTIPFQESNSVGFYHRMDHAVK